MQCVDVPGLKLRYENAAHILSRGSHVAMIVKRGEGKRRIRRGWKMMERRRRSGKKKISLAFGYIIVVVQITAYIRANYFSLRH